MSALSACYLFSVSSSGLLFFHVGQLGSAKPHSGVLGLPTVGHRTLPKIWVGFLYGACSPGNDFELILTVKIEIRHPVEGSILVVNFRRSVNIA